MKTMYYVAYGSNLNLKEFLKRCPNAKFIGTSFINNYRLFFKGDGDGYSYLTLEEDNNSFVPIAIFELPLYDIKSLDKYEGYPTLYHKKYLTIVLNGRPVKVMIYIMNSEYSYHLPSLKYFKTCVEGYEQLKFDKEYLYQAVLVTRDKMSKNR